VFFGAEKVADGVVVLELVEPRELPVPRVGCKDDVVVVAAVVVVVVATAGCGQRQQQGGGSCDHRSLAAKHTGPRAEPLPGRECTE
jgi:hypothetical protein